MKQWHATGRKRGKMRASASRDWFWIFFSLVEKKGHEFWWPITERRKQCKTKENAIFFRCSNETALLAVIFFWFQLLISAIVLRSLLSSTKAPLSNTVTPTNVQPTSKPVTARLDLGGTSVVTPSTWVDIRLVTKKGINLIMFTNGTVAGSWNQSVIEKLGRLFLWSPKCKIAFSK